MKPDLHRRAEPRPGQLRLVWSQAAPAPAPAQDGGPLSGLDMLVLGLGWGFQGWVLFALVRSLFNAFQ